MYEIESALCDRSNEVRDRFCVVRPIRRSTRSILCSRLQPRQRASTTMQKYIEICRIFARSCAQFQEISENSEIINFEISKMNNSFATLLVAQLDAPTGKGDAAGGQQFSSIN